MNLIRFFVEGEPKGQPRPRAFAFNGRARVFDPGTAENWKSCVAVAAKAAGLRSAITGAPVAVTLDFYFRRPKSHYGAKGLRSVAPQSHIGKPDVDNLAKAVLDALSHIGVWHDDSQVDSLTVMKRWTDGLLMPSGCYVSISWKGEK